MKRWNRLLSLLSFIPILANAQAKEDSILLSRGPKASPHVVFIEKNKNRPFLKLLLKRDNVANLVARQLKTIKDEYAIVPTKHQVTELAYKWYPLHLYRGNYYLYLPSDHGTSNWVTITDSAFLAMRFDPGILVSAITRVEEGTDSTTFHIFDPNFSHCQSVVYWIDKEKGVALFKRNFGTAYIEYALRVREDKAAQFPLIVNYYKDRVDEFEFPVPDYARILRERKLE